MEAAEKYSLENAIQFVKQTINSITQVGISDRGLSPQEAEKRENRRAMLKEADRNCIYGDINSKQYLKEYIIDFLTKGYDVNEENINLIINFNIPSRLTTREKFDIILHLYKKKYKWDALERLILTYHLDELGDKENHFITKEEIEEIYKKENVILSFQDKIEIVTQRIYSEYKGLGVIDDIREQNIDGVSGGVNGLPETFLTKETHAEHYINLISKKNDPRSFESVWIFFKGKSIHMRFLSFDSYVELERVTKNVCRYGNPGEFSEERGYIINDTADECRVVSLRPPFCETWCFFIRKLDNISDLSLEYLVRGSKEEEEINANLVIDATKFIMKGGQTTSVTGEQGTGKTTYMLAMVEHIYAVFNLRIQELFFEMKLRRKFPYRNIVTLREIYNITGQEILDLMKKLDGTVNIIGEAAEDKVISWMIQAAQVASKFTLFSHHGKTFNDLIMSLRNSLLKESVFTNEKIAEEQVVSVLDFDIHLAKTIDGFRYVERITECIPLEDEDYPTDFRTARTIDEKLACFMETTLAFYNKMTNKKTYMCRNIIEFDLKKHRYVIKNPISEKRIEKMKNMMTAADAANFEKFLEQFPSEKVGECS